ncbi:MAG: hypothetical protein ACK2UY_02900 [Anaerolineae bacterium]|jgi:predicted HTH domain antitoxin
MDDKWRVGELRDALESLARNPEHLHPDELQGRMRQISKQAIADGGLAEREGRFEEAVALYELAALAFRRLAELASGDLQASELATAEFWAARAELVASRPNRYEAEEETAHSTPQPRAIRTPKPIPLSPKSSIRREQAGRLSSPARSDRHSAQRFERPHRKRVGEHDDQAHDSGSFRKPEEK